MTVSESFNPCFRNSWLYRELRLLSVPGGSEEGRWRALRERGREREKTREYKVEKGSREKKKQQEDARREKEERFMPRE